MCDILPSGRQTRDRTKLVFLDDSSRLPSSLLKSRGGLEVYPVSGLIVACLRLQLAGGKDEEPSRCNGIELNGDVRGL